MRVEDTILSGLLVDEEYTRKVIPHLHKEYFSERSDSILYDEISSFFLKFNQLPTKEILKLQLTQKTGISDADLEDSYKKLMQFSSEKKQLDWILEKTEKFCKDRSLYNAIMKSITIIDGKDKTHQKEAIPVILQEALSVSFDTAVGHQYLEDAQDRYDFYTRVESKIAFDIDILNEITKGGLTRKSLTILLAQSGGGKSLVMTHMASANLRMGHNVLYITMEMAEERIAERIDANLLDVDVDKLVLLGKDLFTTKVNNIAAKTHGRLFIKEYPTGGAHSGHFRALLEELKTKQNFVPDVIYVDYLGICASARVKMGGSVNSYAYLKSISEELRGLATENDVPVVTAGQLNRGGFDNSDVQMGDVADSAGVIFTADLILGIIRTEELDQLNQIMFKQMKNRYSDPSVRNKFIVGLYRSKMKLYNIASDQSYITPDATFAPKQKKQEESNMLQTVEDLDILPKAGIKSKQANTNGFNF